MGATTAGLPLAPGQHYERCAKCGTVFRTKRRTRFRCPKIGCKALMHALAAPDGAAYHRRTLEGDERTFRVYLRRPAEGEEPDPGDDSAALFLEAPEAPAPAPDAPEAPAPGPDGDPVPSPTARRAARDRERGAGSRLGRVWRGSLGELLRRG